MTDGRHISQDDLALYAMQALPVEESAAVRLHLAECAECRGQLAEFTGDLALVAMGVEQQAMPEGARERFVERIGSAPARPQQALRAPVIPIARERRPVRSWSWIPWAAVAALLILSANLFVRVKILNQQLSVEEMLLRARHAENVRAQALVDVLTAPTAQRVTLTAGKMPPAPTARAVYLPSKGALVLQASNMQALPPNKIYELWVIPMEGAAIPAGMFRPDASGSGSVVMPRIPQGVAAKAFGITIENAGGASTPTMPIILAGTAPAAGE